MVVSLSMNLGSMHHPLRICQPNSSLPLKKEQARNTKAKDRIKSFVYLQSPLFHLGDVYVSFKGNVACFKICRLVIHVGKFHWNHFPAKVIPKGGLVDLPTPIGNRPLF